MIKKIVLLTAFLILPLLTVTCSDSGETDSIESVTLDFSGASTIKSVTGLTPLQKASGTTSVIPTDIDTVQIKVTTGTDIVFDETFDRDIIANSSDTITLDIPVGSGRVFTVYARDSYNTLRYTSNSVEVDIVAGANITVNLYLGSDSAVQNVNLAVNLKNSDNTAIFSDQVFLGNSAGYMIIAEIFKPTTIVAGDGTVTSSLGTAISTQSSNTFTANLSGTLLAYSNTYQFVIVRAMSDGVENGTNNSTIAAIGAAVISNLQSGTNSTVDVRMVPPGRINVTYGETITSIKAEMDFGSGFVEVAPTGVISGNTAVLLVPNCVQNISSGQTVYSRPVRITVNGVGTTTISYNSTTPLKWKAVDVVVPLPF